MEGRMKWTLRILAKSDSGETTLNEMAAPARLSSAHRDLAGYFNANRDSLPNYGKRFRADQPIATGWVEPTANKIIAKRMIKKQQMRRNRFTVQPFLTLRVHILDANLEQAFSSWHAGFRSHVAA
jgi:hypothetical protein